MNVEELKGKIEERGYEVKRVRVFKNSFHVTVWTTETKMTWMYKVALASVAWKDLETGFPREHEDYE